MGYFSDLPIPGEGLIHSIKSATSSDLENWTVQSGVRIGSGADTLTESSEQPHAWESAANCITLFYFKAESDSPRLHYSSSSDGQTFTVEYQSTIEGNGPDIIELQDGTLILYYDTSDSLGPAIGAALLEAS